MIIICDKTAIIVVLLPNYDYICGVMGRRRVISEKMETLLDRDGLLTMTDFFAAYPDEPKQTVYARIRSLVKAGRIVAVGRGRFSTEVKTKYSIELSPRLIELNKFLIDKCVGVHNCVSKQGRNMFVEVSREDITRVMTALLEYTPKVISKKDADKLPVALDGYVIVGPLVSEAPLLTKEGVTVPSLEKELVDSIINDSTSAVKQFQRAFDVYQVNRNRLSRYAARRGVSNELEQCVAALNKERISMFTKIQDYLTTVPITKAWVFGSFARCEETASSDLDILVSYDSQANVSLLKIIRWKLDMEKLSGRIIDLVEDGFLKDFARHSADRDKYLIYERRN